MATVALSAAGDALHGEVNGVYPRRRREIVGALAAGFIEESFVATLDGSPAVFLIVSKTRDEDSIEISDAVHAYAAAKLGVPYANGAPNLSADVPALEELANRISTNHTFFWRENSHFEFFQQTVLPELAERHARDGGNVRIWCAGCSSGEEPYTLMMLIMHDVINGRAETAKPYYETLKKRVPGDPFVQKLADAFK